MNRFIIFIWLTLLILITACSSSENNNEKNDVKQDENVQKESLEVVTTMFALEDFIKKVGGEHVNVTNIIPVGGDAHTFEPTTKDMIKIANSDAFIYNGAGLEGFIDAVIGSLSSENVVIVSSLNGINLLEEGHEDGEKNPHVWLYPILAIKMAENAKNTLVELKPEAENDFEENFSKLENEFKTLDQEFREMVTKTPKDTFVVSHEAYGYWTERYGLNQIGILGLSPNNEPSQKQLENTIKHIRENEIEYIIFEQNITPKIANIVKNEVGAESLWIHNLEQLTEEDVQNNEDYLSLMRKNIEALKIALQ